MGAAYAAEEKPHNMKSVTPCIRLVTGGKPHAVTKGVKKQSIELGTGAISIRIGLGDGGPRPTDPQAAVPYGLLHLGRASACNRHAEKRPLAANDGLKTPSLSDRRVPLIN